MARTLRTALVINVFVILTAGSVICSEARAHWNKFTFATPARTAAVMARKLNAQADTRDATCKGGPRHISCVAEVSASDNAWLKYTIVLHKTGLHSGYHHVCITYHGCHDLKTNTVPA